MGPSRQVSRQWIGRRVELSLRGESGTITGQLLSVGEGGIELSPRKSKTNPTAKAPWAKRRPPSTRTSPWLRRSWSPRTSTGPRRGW
jgi:hypothetical protein